MEKGDAMASNKPSPSMKIRAKIIMTLLFFILFSVVVGQFFKISVIDNKRYQEMANDQHFGSIVIPAHRGSVYDAKGSTLAKSASVYKVFLDPKRFRDEMENLSSRIDKRNEEKAKGRYEPETDEDGNVINILPESVEKFRTDTAEFLSQQLGITVERVYEAMEEDNQYSVLQDQVEKPVSDAVLQYFASYDFSCLNVEEDTKRYYPQNELAASVIGFTSADGRGAYGIEAYYDDYLAGVDGRTISAKDSNGNELPYRYSKTYPPQNGDDVYLTIDMKIQYYIEKHLEEMCTEFEVANRGCAILMNAKTGAVYGMGTYPSFDLNNPYEISDEKVNKQLESMEEEFAAQKKAEAREFQWKNKCITETYEPGSVFKVITSASAIEENLINIEKDSFVCTGGVMFPGMTTPINCHETGGHGAQTFQEALTNSCNPAFMEIGGRLGVEKFDYYFNAFGLTEKTGIDLPAEVSGTGGGTDMSEVDLAVSSFGQRETITPMEMITSYCAAINGGYLLQPYVVDKILDEDGNVVFKNGRTVRRQVVSEDTSAKMRDALEKVVSTSGGGNVNIKGYAIGGKSGTSQRLSLGSDDEYGASYMCFAPADDPEIILLVLADKPNKEIGYYGSQVAVPTARDILTDVLPYLGFYPEYTDDEIENLDVKIPLLEGSLTDAIETLAGLGMNYQVVGSGTSIVAQSPVTGTSVAKGGMVYLYTEEKHVTDYVEVPNVVGCSAEFANEILASSGLNYVAKGASVSRYGAAVNSQSIEPGTKVEVGKVIELEFIVYSQQD